MASVARSKKADEPPTPAPETAADRIRRVAAEQLARHDDAVRSADIKPGDPIEPVLVASRGLIEWTAEVAGVMADAARPLSPEAEQLLAERVGTLASAAVKAEAWRFARGAMARTLLIASAGIAALVLVAGGGGYWLGTRDRALTFQVRPGEIAAVCRGDTIQRAPDGLGRICAAWIRLDQASILGAPGR